MDCNHLELNHKKAGFLNLVCLLFSDDVGEREYIQCPETYKDELKEFGHRWIIFLSIVAQKLLYSFKGILECFGQKVELCLNLPSTNGGFLKLITKFLKGNVACPKRDSSTFYSAVGNLDPRLELDSHLKHGDEEYDAYLSMMAAKLSYENRSFVETTIEGVWKMEYLMCEDFDIERSVRWEAIDILKSFACSWILNPVRCSIVDSDLANSHNRKQPSTRAIMFKDQDLIVVAFRGTHPFDADAICTDIDLSWHELKVKGEVEEERVRIHGGFMKALGLQKDQGRLKEIKKVAAEGKNYAYYKMMEKLRERLKGGTKFTVTGHSLGGALAILFVGALCMYEDKENAILDEENVIVPKENAILDNLKGVYTFGQPRVGDEKFAKYMMGKVRDKYYRYVYSSDIVPRLPFDNKVFGFKHFGYCCYYNCLYKGKLLPEEPNKNWSLWLWFLPNILITTWELIRGFILPCVKGRTYRESWALVLFRMIGIVIPGVSAHSPQDYVNLTRLAPKPPLKEVRINRSGP